MASRLFAFSSSLSSVRTSSVLFSSLPHPSISSLSIWSTNMSTYTNPGTQHATPLALARLADEKSAFPTDFSAAGVRCGIKKKKDVLDFAMIRSATPCHAAGVFTTNQFKAGPVIASQALLAKHSSNVYGVVINSGCANACTGERGVQDAHKMMQLAEDAGVKNAVVMSTGVIGPFLDMEKIQAGVRAAAAALKSDADGWNSATQAIMTTDTVPKFMSKVCRINDKEYTLAGMCKGAGMIHPNMATMLGVICTDLPVSVSALQSSLTFAADRSFNCVTVDGDTSTNDSLVVLANGRAPAWKDVKPIEEGSAEFVAFQTQLTTFAAELATLLVKDGEGATKFVTVEVTGAETYEKAKTIASSIATSALVKTALFGEDANWGRIVCAVGYSGIPIQPEKVNLWLIDTTKDSYQTATSSTGVSENVGLQLVKHGRPHDTTEEIASKMLQEQNIHLKVELNMGKANATYWTCDFSYDYVKINADYRS